MYIKKNYLFLFLIPMVLFSLSCRKVVTEVRVNNQYFEGIGNMIVGPDNFGTVNSGQVTGYMTIPEGSGTITGVGTQDGAALTGTYSFGGESRGTHYYTINIVNSSTGNNIYISQP
jgi:hypothetical protein